MPRLITLSVALIVAFSTTAQSTNTIAGGVASGSGGSVSYSVGQVFYQFNTGTNGSVSESIQQRYEIQVVTAIEEAEVITILSTAYPNPTHDYLTLHVEESEISTLSYQLYDMQGILLTDGQLAGNETQIHMGSLPSAIYFVHINRENKPIKIFKIIKN